MHRVRALTNRFDVSAEDIAQMYRYRWKVELFFKFMKQQLRLKKLYSTKEQAVWNQIYLNLIAYLLVELWRQGHAPTMDRGEFITLLRAYLRKPMEALLAVLHRPKERTSRGRRKKGRTAADSPQALEAAAHPVQVSELQLNEA
ncbi:transposase [Cohnella rhizosphaerae]|uniref:Transposase n=1 Tax=Cohnella rhizosphaerae TaxID=1457232 RepID=A0A9X4KPY0_9BACL|nr:transposase [Cohnella rhizosphaerae]MDG0808066.1 transposase [Cohnella rhizosphaerae]